MIDWGRRAARLVAELAACSEPGPGVSRFPFTPEHRAALELLRGQMEALDLTVRLDDAGTLIGRLEGPPGSKVVLIGSHQDSVREGGAYDGIMGVVLPLLALAKLRAEGTRLPYSVEVLAFADEEGVRFPTALIGSRALAGTFDPAVLSLCDGQGVALGDAMRAFGLAPDRIGGLARDPGDVIGFLEVHIEQGPVLERAGEALGVVTAISGIERHQVEVIGETGHAGTMPMAGRRDALVTAAAIVTEVDRLGQTIPDLRATVGAMRVEPNVVNAVPRRVRLTAEFRAPDDATRRDAGEGFHRFLEDLAKARGTVVTATRTYAQAARPSDEALSAHLARAARDAGSRGLLLPSGATHDASAMADLCPIAMLFVRCRDGVSHTPEEFATAEDMGAAVGVLASFLASPGLVKGRGG